MATTTPVRKAESPLVNQILQIGSEAIDSLTLEEVRLARHDEFTKLMKETSTLSLLPALNLLIQPGRVPIELRQELISTLSRLPLRPKGVQHTIEFVLSVHPTTSGAVKEQRPGGGSIISHEALNAASRLLSSPPAVMDAEEWFKGIAPQLFSLLEGDGELEMDKAAAFVIGFGVLGRRQFGAPGTAGWKAFIEPIYRHIDPSLLPDQSWKTASNEKVINIGRSTVLSTNADIATAVRRLSILLTAHPNPALTKRLLRPLLLSLWALGYTQAVNEDSALLQDNAKSLLRALIQLTAGSGTTKITSASLSTTVEDILDNILFHGRAESKACSWKYGRDHNRKVLIEKATGRNTSDMLDLHRIDFAGTAFVNLLKSSTELSGDVSILFLRLFRKWTEATQKPQPQILLRSEVPDRPQDLQRKVIDAILIQKLIDSFPDNLVEDSHQVLEITSEVLSRFDTEPDDDMIAVSLSLLNIVLTSPKFKTHVETDSILQSIQASLENIGRSQRESAMTAKNLLLLLKYRSYMEEPESSTGPVLTDQQEEDRKTHKLAMSYLTTIDSPAPVRVHGIELLSGLVKINSPVLDISALLILYSSLLQDKDEYIYLRTVKAIVQLSERHPKTVLKDLVDRYVDPQEDADLDQRLRFGEALLQVIQSRPLAFVHDIVKTVCEGLLFIASRRGRRVKTEQNQERREKLRKKKDADAKEAWDGDVPQLDDDDEELRTAEDKELLSRIVGGWESKRGSEDIRIRTSALAILAQAIEINVSGIPPYTLSTAVDMCIHILTLEPEPEKGILRRSAILLILSFAKALDNAQQEGRSIGFGFVGQSLQDVKRILEYTHGSDNDGLVRRHAQDVIESLEAWEMNMLTSGGKVKEQTELQELAGLAVNPMSELDARDRIRPRIEEIE